MGIPNVFRLSRHEIGSGRHTLPARYRRHIFCNLALDSNQARFLAVRPENIRVSRTPLPDGNGNNVIRGRVRQARYLGSSVLWNVEVNSVIWTASEVVNGSRGMGSVSLEDEVYLSWEPSRGVLVP